MKSHHNHHRRNSSVTSLSASAAKNPEKIERLQAFDKWRAEQTDLSPNLFITEIYVHLSHDSVELQSNNKLPQKLTKNY